MNNISKLSYQYDKEIDNKQFYAEKTFVLLDWLIIERVFQDRNFFDNEFSQIPDQQKLRICYNILPNQKSIMHMIAQDSTLPDATVIMKALFAICKNPNIEDITRKQH